MKVCSGRVEIDGSLLGIEALSSSLSNTSRSERIFCDENS